MWNLAGCIDSEGVIARSGVTAGENIEALMSGQVA
jgi:hypothetical protein